MGQEASGSGPTRAPTHRFPTTHWSNIVAAGDPGSPRTREALAELCGTYWYPLYTYIRRRGYGADAAMDLVQEYFAGLLERGALSAADPARGRFRTFLLADCGNFLAKQHRSAAAQKRGGGRVVPIDGGDAEARFLREPAHDLTPERLFERAWALALLERVLGMLRAEYERAGKADLFDQLKSALGDGTAAPRSAEVARALGTSEGAVRVAVHRLRRRYRDLLAEQVAATLGDPAEVEDEVRALFAALGH